MLHEVQAVRERLTPAQLGHSPATVDLTQTLVVPVPAGVAAAVGRGGGGVATQTPPQGIPAPPRSPSGPVVGGPGQLPTAGRGQGRRGVLAFVLVLALLALVIGIGAWFVGSGRWTTTPSVIDLDRTHAGSTLDAA